MLTQRCADRPFWCWSASSIEAIVNNVYDAAHYRRSSIRGTPRDSGKIDVLQPWGYIRPPELNAVA